MENTDTHKTKSKARHWDTFSVKQKQCIYIGAIIGAVMIGLGIAFLFNNLSIIAAGIIFGVGLLILISTCIVWIYWNKKIINERRV
ncbi:MAG: hypothetical protein LBD63_00390 [Mycoplasmataceae bacterium]|nr:hypothetical protein [Mycoplasmataceae bacterium]